MTYTKEMLIGSKYIYDKDIYTFIESDKPEEDLCLIRDSDGEKFHDWTTNMINKNPDVYGKYIHLKQLIIEIW